MRRKPVANLRGDGQKRHIRLSLWPSYHDITKASDASGRVNGALVQRKLKSLYGEIWLACVPEAVGLGRSRKKWWGRSKNPVINKALSDKYLVNQGLISIKDLWVQFHYPK